MPLHMKFCAGIVLLFLLFFTPARVYAAVVLNEIFPKTENPAQQWIELYNTGSEDMLLDLWELEHAAGGESFRLDGFIIRANDFLLLSQTQTGVTLSAGGDTVRLMDPKGTHGGVDNVSYPSSLVQNTALGRSPNGTGGWGICPNATPGIPNTCLLPSPTETPLPTPTYTPTPSNSPTPTGTPGPTSTPGPSGSPTPPPIDQKPPDTPAAEVAILGTNIDPQAAIAPEAPLDLLAGADIPVATPTPVAFMQSEAYRYLWVAGIGIGVLLAVVVVIVGRNHKKRKIVLHI